MKLFSTIDSVKHELNLVKSSGRSIGFVPTMGALHDGHLSLIEQSKKLCDVTIASIFVNPTQFNNPADLEKYPRNLEKDISLLDECGCDYVFSPEENEMYPKPAEIEIRFGEIEKNLEGKSRPGHFKGVGLVVSKLFNIVTPSYAFFGQKDLQQFYIVKKLIKELNLPVKLIRVPIIREENGLAMSSRNERLEPSDRQNAKLIYETLIRAKEYLDMGYSIQKTKDFVNTTFSTEPRMNLEYFEIVETQQFSTVSDLNHEEIALCIAVNIDQVRLIDNILLFS